MNTHNPDRWFTARTARRAGLYISASDADEPLQPIFWRKSFLFAKDEEPTHINQIPMRNSGAGLYEVYGITQEGNQYPLAIDIDQLSVAAILARARVRHLERAALLGYSDGVYIRRPDGTAIIYDEKNN